ncbi:hypothetical protein BJ875DRAFT_487492 [Amylocarpus encephaloides]|uniref:Methyltransferase domain-containing protein n=1 Tax=Amylocarpus encephaloides TaxID=45428 RepID=A0A9P7YC26_9HELO|nr:hypothetical protein BJ875DRAFT_487492 [Amylocarpus encephaloides]
MARAAFDRDRFMFDFNFRNLSLVSFSPTLLTHATRSCQSIRLHRLVEIMLRNPRGTEEFVYSDAATSQRLLDQHHVVIDALGGRPILPSLDVSRGGLRILDSGTADGHWLREIDHANPWADSNDYVGTDLNVRWFPQSHPDNFQFYQHNVADAWPVDQEFTFDLVHQRLTLPGAAPAPLSQAIHNLFRLVKPGGWIQLIEAEQIAPASGPVFDEFLTLVRDVFDSTGAGWKYAAEMRKWLEVEGAVDITEISVDMALGATHRQKDLAEKGASCTAGAMDGLVMHAKALQLETGLNDAQLTSLPHRLYTELTEAGAHYPLRAVWGRRRRTDE